MGLPKGSKADSKRFLMCPFNQLHASQMGLHYCQPSFESRGSCHWAWNGVALRVGVGQSISCCVSKQACHNPQGFRPSTCEFLSPGRAVPASRLPPSRCHPHQWDGILTCCRLRGEPLPGCPLTWSDPPWWLQRNRNIDAPCGESGLALLPPPGLCCGY